MRRAATGFTPASSSVSNASFSSELSAATRGPSTGGAVHSSMNMSSLSDFVGPSPAARITPRGPANTQPAPVPSSKQTISSARRGNNAAAQPNQPPVASAPRPGPSAPPVASSSSASPSFSLGATITPRSSVSSLQPTPSSSYPTRSLSTFARPSSAASSSSFSKQPQQSQSLQQRPSSSSSSSLRKSHESSHSVTFASSSLLNAAASASPSQPPVPGARDYLQTEYEAAMEFYDEGKYEDCKEVLQEALSTFAKTHCQDAELLGNLYLGMGVSLFAEGGKDAQAIEMYQKCISVLESKFGKNYPGALSAYVNVGLAFMSLQKLEDALTMFLTASKLGENILGVDRLTLSIVFHNIGCIYDRQGKIDDALRMYEKAHRIRTGFLGRDCDHVASLTMENMAQILKDQRKYDQAIEMQKKVMEIRKRDPGLESAEYALALHNMGLIYMSQNKHALANPFFRKAATLRCELLGIHHPDTESSNRMLALTRPSSASSSSAPSSSSSAPSSAVSSSSRPASAQQRSQPSSLARSESLESNASAASKRRVVFT